MMWSVIELDINTIDTSIKLLVCVVQVNVEKCVCVCSAGDCEKVCVWCR